MKVINRSDGNVTYVLPELNTRRVFTPWESKDITPQEMEALFQTDGGREIIINYLLVDDKEWVENHFDAPIEYFWKEEEIKKCMLEEDVELFAETLDYAPDGVIDLIKFYAYTMPLGDLNKIQVLTDKTGFDTLSSIQIMKNSEAVAAPVKSARRRREE